MIKAVAKYEQLFASSPVTSWLTECRWWETGAGGQMGGRWETGESRMAGIPFVVITHRNISAVVYQAGNDLFISSIACIHERRKPKAVPLVDFGSSADERTDNGRGSG
jgi:hypothetical protein